MKKTLQRLGIAMVGLSLCLWSCKEQDGLLKPEDATSTVKVAPKIKENIDFSVVEGRLKFATNEDFTAAIAKSSTQEGAKTWEDLAGFTSLDEAYRDYVSKNAEKVIGEVSKEYDDAVFVLTDNEGKKSYERAVTMSALVALINQKGIVQIADKVLKISDADVRIVEVNFKSELELDSPSSHVKINKVTHGDFKGKSNKGAKVNSEYNRYDSKPYAGGSTGFSPRRLENHKYATLYNVGYTFLWNIGCHIRNDRDNWNGWGQENVAHWSYGAGYVQIGPNFQMAPYVTNTTFTYNSLPYWSGNSNAPGNANIYIEINGQLNPPNGPYSQLYGINVAFYPGTISAYTDGLDPVSLENMGFDTITLPVWSNASI